MQYQKVDIDVLYSPSKWCKRFDGEGSIRYFKNFVKKGSDHVRNTIPCELNYTYGNDTHEKFDIYGHNLPKDSPIFIFIHGGYWQEYSKDESCFMAEMFYNKNIKTMVVGFRNVPLISLKGLVQEVTYAVEQCLKLAQQWGSKKVVIAGHSSGGHLVSCILQQLHDFSDIHREMIQGIVLISGIYDLVPLVDTYANEVLRLTKEEAKDLSPHYQSFTDKDHKVYVVVPQYESPAFKEQSEKFYKKLKDEEKIKSVEFLTLKNEDHFKIVENLTDSHYELSQLIISLLK